MVSYESFLAEFPIPPNKLGEECDEKVLNLVGSKLTTWRNAAPHFEMEHAVNAIENGKHDEDGKRLELLRCWKQKFGYQAKNEKLIRCLLNAERTDLAGTAAKAIMGYEHSPKSSTSDTPYPTMPCAYKTFASSSTGYEESSFSSRGIPLSSTHEDDPQHRIPLKIPQQSTGEENDRSKLISNTRAPVQQASTGITGSSSDGGGIVSRLMDLFHLEKREKMDLLQMEKKEKADLLQTQQEEKVERLEKKREQIQKLKERMESKTTKIEELEQQVLQAGNKLEEQKQLRCKAEKALENKESVICQLQEDISQKEIELKEEQDKNQELLASAEDQLQQHKKKVARLHRYLNQANLDLEKEKKAKDVFKEQFDQFSQHIISLKQDISKAKSGVNTAHGEKHCLKEVLEWAEEDLVEDQEEVEKLKEMMRRKNDVLTTYRVIMVFTFACIIAVMLQNMDVLP